MSEHLIHGDTMTAVANQARKLSNTTDELNAAEIAEIFSRIQGDIKTSGEYLVEAIDAGGEVEKSGMYDTGEIFALPRAANSIYELMPSGYETVAKFDKWVATSPMNKGFIVVRDNPIRVAPLYKPMDNFLLIAVNIENDNTTITLRINNPKEINWGDGVLDTNPNAFEQIHVYTSVGKYLIKIPESSSIGITYNIGGDSITRSVITGIVIPEWICNAYGLYHGFDNFANLQYVLFEDGVKPKPHSTIFATLQGNPSLECICLPSSFLNSSNSLPDNFLKNSGVKSVVLPYGIVTIPYGCFAYCNNLTDIVIPDSVTSIGEQAFGDCVSLTSIEIPAGVTEIPRNCFIGCSSLTDITIPSSVTSIGDSAFYGCSSLKNINIPHSVTTLGDYAFGCSYSNLNFNYNIETLVLPSVASIGIRAFYGLNKLRTIVLCTDNVCVLSGQDHADIINLVSYGNVTIYVPDDLVDDYEADQNWSMFLSGTVSYIKPLSEYTGTI